VDKIEELKGILLSDGRITWVDASDYDWLRQWKWHTTKSTNTIYASRNINSNNGRKTLLMHRLILGLMSDTECDHIDGNGLNNRRSNLRPCSHQQNAFNAKIYRKTSSEFRGVSWRKGTDKWAAYIKFNGQQIHLGFFADEVDAARAYNGAAMKYFGVFAHLNNTGGSK